MKKNRMGISYKSWLFLIFFVVAGSFVSSSYGQEEERKNAEEERKTKYGFSVLWGTGDVFYTQTDMKVYGFLPRISFPLRKDWKYWDIELEGDFFYYKIQKMHDVYFLGIGQNTVFKPIQKRWGTFFLLLGGGLGYDSAGKKLFRGPSESPLLGDQHFAGFVNAGAGMLFNIGRRTALRVEYRLCHISEPFDTSDRGLNTHHVLLGIAF